MKFLILFAALLVEQVRPLRQGNRVHGAYEQFLQRLQHAFDGGQYRQGVAAWTLAVVPLIVLVIAIEWFLARFHAPLDFVFGVGVLYLTVGFRKFSNFFNEINKLLATGDIPAAREQLRHWRNEDSSELDSNAVARVAIELGLVASHRNVFGPVVWFMVFGPAGALLYRVVATAQAQWQARTVPDAAASSAYAHFAVRVFGILDWLPARLTAASFAVMGNFQDAVECWRSQAAAWGDRAQGILLASGAGALGVKLGGELKEYGRVRYRPELGTGDEADADYLSSGVGLIWRVMVLWMLLLLVVTIAYSMG